MKIFVYEFICGGGLASQPLPDSLRAEGAAMLRSVCQDLSECHQVSTCLDERMGWPDGSVQVHRVGPGDERSKIQSLASAADLALVIAPESEAVLAARSEWIDDVETPRIGPSLEAIRLCTDKFALNRHLLGCGVPAAAGRPVNLRFWSRESSLRGKLLGETAFPAVLKPREGAGSQATFLIQKAAEFGDVCRQAGHESSLRDALLEPYYAGTPASVSFLMGSQSSVCLMPCRQRLATAGRIRYLGGVVPLERGAGRAVQLAQRAVACVAGLAGFVSVDLVLGANEDEDRVIEINPRLSTSYVGLRALFRGNLSELMLHVFLGKTPAPLCWKSGTVKFQSDGRID